MLGFLDEFGKSWLDGTSKTSYVFVDVIYSPCYIVKVNAVEKFAYT